MKKILFLLMFPVLCFGQYTSITDKNFEKALIDLEYDDIIDSVVLTANINSVDSLSLYRKNISDLTGIEDFIALSFLNCSSNQLTNLDVSQNTALTGLYCDDNQLTNLDITKNTALTGFSCYKNKLNNLDVSKNTALTKLSCSTNKLTSLDVSQNIHLIYYLSCGENKLTNLDVSQNTALSRLYCDDNQLTNLDVSKNTALIALGCGGNKFDCDSLKAKFGLNYEY